MIDYLSGRIRLPVAMPALLPCDHVMKASWDGEVRWLQQCRVQVPGSFEASFSIGSPSTTELVFQGNPVKFLQGHNLYGPSEPAQLLWEALRRIEELPGTFPCSLAQMGLYGPESLLWCTELSRVDVTFMELVERESDIGSFLRAIQVTGRLQGRGKSGLGKTYDRGGGVVFGDSTGKSFTHRQIVCYSKGRDIVAHPLPALMLRGEILEWVNRCIRWEVRLGRNYLRKSGLRALENWTPETAGKEWSAMMARMDFSGADLEPEGLDQLPPRLQMVYHSWRSGADISQLSSKATFYRRVKELREALNVDVSRPCPTEPTAEIVPFRRRIQLRPAARPRWADQIDQELRQAGAFVFGNVA